MARNRTDRRIRETRAGVRCAAKKLLSGGDDDTLAGDLFRDVADDPADDTAETRAARLD